MTTVALFHSVLGVRPGIHDAADGLRAAGHEVAVADLFEGRVFDDYEEGIAFEQELGYPTLLERAMQATSGLPDRFVTMGFSMGCAPAVFVAIKRPVSGVVMVGGAIAPSDFEMGLSWPSGLPAQTHSTVNDPWRQQEMVDGGVREISDYGGTLEVFDYPGDGHLFMDPSLPKEYDPEATELFWSRVLPFLATVRE